jgi:vacuolar-type H+-ATPase subunit F/Vma7
MALCSFIGDPLTAAGFRLAGAEVYSPPPAEVTALFRRLLEQTELLILTAETVAAVPEPELRRAQTRGRPLVLVVGDARSRSQAPDLAEVLSRRLGMGE